MEALQILKFIYKKERLNFTAGLNSPTEEAPVEGSSAELLADLFTENKAKTTDRLLEVCGSGDSDTEEWGLLLDFFFAGN